MQDENNAIVDSNEYIIPNGKIDICKPKKSLKERCEEMGAIPLSQFEKEFWEAFYEGYRKQCKR